MYVRYIEVRPYLLGYSSIFEFSRYELYTLYPALPCLDLPHLKL